MNSARPALHAHEELLTYIERIHQRTRRVVELIPAEHLESSPGAGRFTLGDLVRHLAAVNRYMFIETAAGRPSLYASHDASLASGLDAVLAFHARLHEEGMEVLRAFAPERFDAKCTTPDGTQITVWKWLRAMTEHEAHHRGQIYWRLAALGVKTPPIFGLTSEEVRERSAGGAR